jgi:hypothetical protein
VPPQLEAVANCPADPASQTFHNTRVHAVTVPTTLEQAPVDVSGKGWLDGGRQPQYGWVMICNINAKNSYGGYTDAERFGFVFRDGELHRGSKLLGSFLGSGVTQVVYDNP